MRQKIALVSDIAVILVAALVAVVVIKNYVLAPSTPIALLRTGETLSDVDSLRPDAAHGRRLLLVLKKGCPYCEGSTPLYKELAQLERSGQTDVKMIAVFQDPEDVARSLLDAEDINMKLVGGVHLKNLGSVSLPRWCLLMVAAESSGSGKGFFLARQKAS